jgi:serine/threonine-protein phosphatase 6 regulatory subunit 3
MAQWLSSENLMGRLIELLSPTHTGDIHTVVAELIKGIISMATPSPGAGLTEGLQNGPASNCFARQLARRESISTLMTYILHDFSAPPDGDGESDEGVESKSQQLPNFGSSTSSVVHSISVIVELIRKNNSDYFEPYLFHTLRNRLIQVQQQLPENSREALEQAMKEMVERMGVVHLGPLLEIMCTHLETLQYFLKNPRSLVRYPFPIGLFVFDMQPQAGPISTTVGSITPLTFERYRICELFAELLHCSNMSLLNRSPSMDHLYDSDGRLQGGLSALETLGQIISSNNVNDRGHEAVDETNDEMEPALELPISHAHHDSSSLDSDDDMSDSEAGSSDDDAMEEIVMYDEPHAQLELSPISSETALPSLHITVPSSPNTASMPSPSEIAAHGAALSRVGPHSDAGRHSRSHSTSRRSSRRATTNGDASLNLPLPMGDKLKRRFLEIDIASTILVSNLYQARYS